MPAEWGYLLRKRPRSRVRAMQPEMLEYALYPSPTSEHALGLLLCKVGEQRCTAIVEAEWLRTLIAGNTAGVDFRGLEVPAECALPGLLEGWPDDWPDDSPYPALLDGLTELLTFGLGWDGVRASTLHPW